MNSKLVFNWKKIKSSMCRCIGTIRYFKKYENNPINQEDAPKKGEKII